MATSSAIDELMDIPLAMQDSLFEPSGASSLESSASWLGSIMFGEIALTLCVIAVVMIGLAMLSGRISLVRSGLTVVGCFVLIGAPGLAAALMSVPDRSQSRAVVILPPQAEQIPPRPELPPVRSDPYAGASLPGN